MVVRRFTPIVFFFLLAVTLVVAACKQDDSKPTETKRTEVQPPPEIEDGGVDSPYYFSTPHTGAPSSLSSCVNTEPTLECVLCPRGEICFTQLACSDSSCIERNSARPHADNRCHRECATSNDCGPDEDCFHEPFTACTSYNGGPQGRGLCCSFGGCETN
jgi:hypothetical protein